MAVLSGVPAETFSSSAGKLCVPLQSRAPKRLLLCNLAKYHSGAISGNTSHLPGKRRSPSLALFLVLELICYHGVTAAHLRIAPCSVRSNSHLNDAPSYNAPSGAEFDAPPLERQIRSLRQSA